MLRISKLTDYATGLMIQLARAPDRRVSAQQLATELGLPLPTVAALLKKLARAQLVASTRGPAGGYSLTRRPDEISVAAVIAAVEGPVALTECALGDGNCDMETMCTIRPHWRLISHAVQVALDSVSLADMTVPATQPMRFQALPKHT